MSHREMHQWLVYIDMQQNEPNKNDWYMAQIAYMVYMLQFVFGGVPKHKLKDFLITFKKKDDEEQKLKLLTPQERREHLLKKAKASQQIWQAVLNKKATKSPAKPPVRNSEKTRGRKNAGRKSSG